MFNTNSEYFEKRYIKMFMYLNYRTGYLNRYSNEFYHNDKIHKKC